MKTLALAAAALLAVTCAAAAMPREMTVNLQPGMTAEQVIQTLGRDPDSRRIRNGEDCLIFSFWRDFWNRRPGNYSDRYFACFKKGKLYDFGMVDDRF
jgi:hypothetical protein